MKLFINLDFLKLGNDAILRKRATLGSALTADAAC